MDNIASYVLQYACLFIEGVLVFYVGWRSQWRRQGSVAFYLSALLAAGLARAYVLQEYGFASRRYYYTYWSTDFLLVISTFLLVCLFFRRACMSEEKMWRRIRLLILFVFVLVAAVSGLTLSHNRGDFFSYFIVEFNQNLYFTCLVLNTLLYLLLQHIDSADDQLGLLVCGVGVQFAGPAATLALFHLTSGGGFARLLGSLAMRFCTLGMLMVWAYAIVGVERPATRVVRDKALGLAEATVNLNSG